MIKNLKRAGLVLVHAAKDLLHDSGPQWAAAIAYYSLLSLFPLLVAIVAIAAFFVEERWAVEQATRVLVTYLPQGTQLIDQVISDAIAARGSFSILSIAALLWSGTRVFGAITIALNIAYDAEEKYGFWKRTLIEFVMLVTIGVLFACALILPFVQRLIVSVLQLLPAGQALIAQVAGEIAAGLMLLIACFLTYRFVPRRAQDWRAALAGAVIATLLVLVARPLFFNYVEYFGQYNLTYGSIAVVIVLVFWAWITALILLFGGELAAHVQTILIEGQPAEEVERRHQERSPKRAAPAARS